jgi:hypothetical protein
VTPCDILRLAKPAEIPHLLRWVDLSVRAGWMSEEQATDWRLRLLAIEQWFGDDLRTH